MPLQKFNSKILEKKMITHDVMLLDFTFPEAFTLKAGQYVQIKVMEGDQVRYKAFSVLNPPKEKKLLICAKIIDGGVASEAFKSAKVGDEFEMKGPIGMFVFDEETENNEHFFVCAGTGLAPIYSMIFEHIDNQKDKKFTLIFGTREKKNLLFHEELEALKKTHDNFEYHPTLTRENWEGKTGRVHVHLPKDVSNKTFYICGLKELVIDTKEILLKNGVKPSDIKTERYN